MGGEGPTGSGGWWVFPTLGVISGFFTDEARSESNGVKWVGSLSCMKNI